MGRGGSEWGEGGAGPARGLPANAYGRFSPDGSEYVVTDPRTPRPWSNVIASPRLGLAVSQTGSGFTWIDNAQLAVLTAWQQEFARDESGKFLYLRDAQTGALWSASPSPVWAKGARHECRHGIGYTVFTTLFGGIESRWTLFAHAEEPVEIWLLALRDLTGRARRLETAAYLEWCVGVAPAPRREFHRLFIETAFDKDVRAILAENHMWDVPDGRWGHWNRSFPYVAAFGTSAPLRDVLGDKSAFIGRYGTFRHPEALRATAWNGTFGRHSDPVAALRSDVKIPANGTVEIVFALAAGSSREEARTLVRRFADPGAAAAALHEVRAGWRARLAGHRIETPEPALDALANDWIRYQAISARLWGRCGYYQQSGAFGFRDQLQDSQVWLTIDPELCRAQIRLHASHQFADGSVYHWWHPLSEVGHRTAMTDDLLWTAFVSASYLKETGRFDLLDDPAPFVDDAGQTPLRDHVERALLRVFERTSARGIPYIGAGDWNDGLSAVGLEERGESFWLGMFLAGILADWAEVLRRTGDPGRAAELEGRRRILVEAINAHGWDGDWYLAATRDDGEPLGSARNERGRIHLNPQTWAILNDVAPPDRAKACLDAVRERLVTDAGALLLAPAYDRPVREIGYITRYAPGVRENGGVYMHAATWAIAAACKAKDAKLAGHLLTAVNPANKDPDRYGAEPYVLPGNVDGPDSPSPGRGGWTWYTGSAAWLHRIVCEWVLGVRPTWDGLIVDPCLPPEWSRAAMTRPWRGSTYRITIERAKEAAAGRMLLDGSPVAGGVLGPPEAPGEVHDVLVRFR